MTLLIDLSYFIFYRYYATYNWYRKQNGAKPEVMKDPIFIEKYDKIFENTVLDLKKKHELEWKDIYFAKDCSREDIWRTKYYKEYKGTRDERLETFDKEIFKHTISTLIPKLQEKYGDLHILSVDHMESDDIIAVVKEYIRSKDSQQEVFIITNDNDYVQLIDDFTLVVNLQGKDLKTRIDMDPQKYLAKKIILGDKSDNIPSIGKKIGDKTAEKLAENPEELDKLFAKRPETKQQYDLNKLLISFEMIPKEHKKKILENYLKTI